VSFGPVKLLTLRRLGLRRGAFAVGVLASLILTNGAGLGPGLRLSYAFACLAARTALRAWRGISFGIH
jgi:hypothetical protein